MRALVVALAACAAPAPALSPHHPARASAPVGRLAGPPASLRAGAIAYPDVPPVRAQEPEQHHHHHGS